MADENDRFVRSYKQVGVFSREIEIWVDKSTGVNYMVMPSGYGHSLTPLLNRDGSPMVTAVSHLQEQ